MNDIFAKIKDFFKKIPVFFKKIPGFFRHLPVFFKKIPAFFKRMLKKLKDNGVFAPDKLFMYVLVVIFVIFVFIIAQRNNDVEKNKVPEDDKVENLQNNASLGEAADEDNQAQSQNPVLTNTLTPVPTDTPVLTQEIVVTLTPVPSITPTDVPKPTSTPMPPMPEWLLLTLTPQPTATNTPVPTATSIPTVEIGRKLNTDYENTVDFLVNRSNRLPSDYEPADLVKVNIPFKTASESSDKRKLRREPAMALEKMYQDALKENIEIWGVSGYRSFDRQYTLYTNYIFKNGIEHTNYYSAVPGTSEHQTGLAMDIACKEVGYTLDDKFADTETGIWVSENCWKYGFIIRYTKAKENITGYMYEPWHIRYVGIPLAYYLTVNGLTLEEYYDAYDDEYNIEAIKDKILVDVKSEQFVKEFEEYYRTKVLRDRNGVPIIDSDTQMPIPLKNVYGSNGNRLTYTNPVSKRSEYVCYMYGTDKDGRIISNPDGDDILFEPLRNSNGSLRIDGNGELIYNDFVFDENGDIVYDEDGWPLIEEK
ncbi:MAG: D-alanyl-D-alanine carboxypeptidase family protein [Lachnospiraceae bacterium]|nr:D-alanyl-D-alanine carboxypeptidase family protein [Lachnospiraceae bacterium]